METTLRDRLRRIADRSTLQVTHIGRKSGKAYQVTTWFVVDRDVILLPTSTTNRNWVRNLRKSSRVELAIRSERFVGSAKFLENQEDRDRVLAMVKRKYAVATPYMLIARMLAMIGVGKIDFGAFEVSLSG